jgi:hypothetical protein
MGRKISVGIVGSGGSSGLGTIIASGSGNTLSTALANQDLIIDPNGTGGVNIQADLTITDQQDLRLRESAANGTNYIGMQAAATMAANYTITWPAAVSSTSGFFLSSDTSGNLSWVSAGGNISITDPGSSATVHYPLFGTNAGALPSTLAPNARSNLTFVPSTGELTATIGSFANVYGSTANSGTVTIRGTSSATKAGASVLMSDNVTSTTTTTGTLVVTGGVGISGAIFAGGTVTAANLTTSGTLTAGTITETSSIVYKENVSPIKNALESVMQLIGVTYDRKDGSRQNEAGLIAEQVAPIIPNVVTYKDGKPEGINYTKLSAYLIEAVKSLKNEIDILKGKN